MRDLQEKTREFLKINGISGAFAAKYCGISPSHFAHWLNHYYAITNPEVLDKIRKLISGGSFKAMPEDE